MRSLRPFATGSSIFVALSKEPAPETQRTGCLKGERAAAALLCGMRRDGVPAGDGSAATLVLNTRVSALGGDVANGWDAAACAAGRDGDGIVLVSAMAERAPQQSLPAVAGAVPREIPRCTPSSFLSTLCRRSNNDCPFNLEIAKLSRAENFSQVAVPRGRERIRTISG